VKGQFIFCFRELSWSKVPFSASFKAASDDSPFPGEYSAKRALLSDFGQIGQIIIAPTGGCAHTGAPNHASNPENFLGDYRG